MSDVDRVLRRGEPFTVWHACGHRAEVHLGAVPRDIATEYQRKAQQQPCSRCRIEAEEKARKAAMTPEDRKRRMAVLWPDD